MGNNPRGESQLTAYTGRDTCPTFTKEDLSANLRLFGETSYYGTNRAGQSVIRTDTSSGSGVSVRKDGVIVTDNHVVQGLNQITLEYTDPQTGRISPIPAHVIKRDPAHDLAAVRPDIPIPLPVMTLGSTGDLFEGRCVVGLGFPASESAQDAATQDHILHATSGPVQSLGRVADAAPGLLKEHPEWDPNRIVMNAEAFAHPGISGGGFYYRDQFGKPKIGSLIDFTKFQTDRNGDPVRRSDGSIVYNKYAGSTPVEYVQSFLNTVPFDQRYADAVSPPPPPVYTPKEPPPAPPLVAKQPAEIQTQARIDLENFLHSTPADGRRPDTVSPAPVERAPIVAPLTPAPKPVPDIASKYRDDLQNFLNSKN